MATHKDYQALANKVYDKDNIIEIKNGGTEPTIWTKVLEKDNPDSGYYGAVYSNGNGEYVLVN